MKRNTSKFLTLLLILAMSLCLAACGSAGDTAEDTDQTAESGGSDADAQQDTDEEDEDKGTALYASVADYVNSDELQTSLKALKESQSDGITIDILVDESNPNTMVYKFTYETLTHTDGDGLAEGLETAIASQDETFQNTADALLSYIDTDTVTVEVRYVDQEGTVIFSKSYTANQ